MPSLQSLKRPFIVFGKPNIGEDEIEAVTDVLRSGWIGTGKVSHEFEDAFTYHMGSGFSIAVSSCTIGLTISLKALGVGPGDEVITSPLTFAATVNAILACGAKPVFVDVDETGCLNPELVFKAKTSRTEVVIPIHYTGSPVNMKPLKELCDELGFSILEDAAHSFGGTYLGQKQGSLGDLGVFSFYATKNITAGEGGMIYTKNKNLAEICRTLSQNGQSSEAWDRYSSSPIKTYEVKEPGYKGNLPDVLAAIGLSQLRRWPELKENRDRVWGIYEKAFGRKELGHSKHLFTILVKNRDEVRRELYENNIGTGIHYTPLHLEPAYSFLGYKRGSFPLAEKIGSQTLSLPVSNSMSEEDAHYVVKNVRNIVN